MYSFSTRSSVSPKAIRKTCRSGPFPAMSGGRWSRVMSSPSQRMTARSTAFFSSRMLPGQS